MKRTVFGFLGPVPSPAEFLRSVARRAVIALVDQLHDGCDSVGHRGAVLADAETRAEKMHADYVSQRGYNARELMAKMEAVQAMKAKAMRAYKFSFETSQKVEALLTRCDGA